MTPQLAPLISEARAASGMSRETTLRRLHEVLPDSVLPSDSTKLRRVENGEGPINPLLVAGLAQVLDAPQLVDLVRDDLDRILNVVEAARATRGYGDWAALIHLDPHRRDRPSHDRRRSDRVRTQTVIKLVA